MQSENPIISLEEISLMNIGTIREFAPITIPINILVINNTMYDLMRLSSEIMIPKISSIINNFLLEFLAIGNAINIEPTHPNKGGSILK